MCGMKRMEMKESALMRRFDTMNMNIRESTATCGLDIIHNNESSHTCRPKINEK